MSTVSNLKHKAAKTVWQEIMDMNIELCQKAFREYDVSNTGYINYFDLKSA